MSVNTNVGIRLHDLNSGLLSRELRLHVVLCSQRANTLVSTKSFHSSRPNRGLPVIAALLGGLKSSTALSVLNTVFRVAFTFIPAILVKNRFLRKFVKKIPTHFPQFTEKTAHITKHIKWNRYIVRVLWIVPMVLLAATMLASVERAPLTGRWRFILISPKEEEDIIQSLSESWRSAVDSVLASTLESGIPPPTVPFSDWRYQWVESTLRRLEAVVPLLQAEQTANPKLLNDKDYPFPPPCLYPLAPRPRPAQLLHSWAEHSTFNDQVESQPPLVGPPYSCLVVEKPDSQNAFSYGFGPKGAGGVVVYTGFLDEVLKNSSYVPPTLESKAMPSFWSTIFGSLMFSPKKSTHLYIPSEEQTAELAVLLAHELSHLLLSHHLESLSSGTILYPSVISIFTDVARTVLFPITMLLGPFVNDALAQVGRVQSGEMGKLSEMCSGRQLEIEADIVSARLLAYAGIDPREAVKFWESRINETKRAECAVQGKTPESGGRTASWAMGSETHPLHEERVRRLKAELASWEKAWSKLSQRQHSSAASSSS